MFGCDFLIRDYCELKKKGEEINRVKAGTKKSKRSRGPLTASSKAGLD
jgi:hypothetical protein